MSATGAPGCVAIRPARTIKSRSGTCRVSNRRAGTALASRPNCAAGGPTTWTTAAPVALTRPATAPRHACAQGRPHRRSRASAPAHDVVVVAQLADREHRRVHALTWAVGFDVAVGFADHRGRERPRTAQQTGALLAQVCIKRAARAVGAPSSSRWGAICLCSLRIQSGSARASGAGGTDRRCWRDARPGGTRRLPGGPRLTRTSVLPSRKARQRHVLHPVDRSCDRTPAAPRASEPGGLVRHLGRRLIAGASLRDDGV